MKEPLSGAEIRLTIRGSRFIGILRRVESDAEAKAAIAGIRESHSGASHVAYAFAIGPERSLSQGHSDDGEPHGTAGRPILDQISGADLTSCLVTVVRYFGGTKLGTGGLARAYGEAAKAAIEKSGARTFVERRGFRLEVSYRKADSLFRLIDELGGTVEKREFGGAVRIVGALPVSAVDEFCRQVADLTSGKSYPEISERSSA